MAAEKGPNLGLTSGWPVGSSGWNVEMDANLRMLDAVVGASVVGVANAPATQTEGTRYIVGASPSGAFSGNAGALAVYLGGGWQFYQPKAGWTVFHAGLGVEYVFDGSTWRAAKVEQGDAPFLSVSSPGQWSAPISVWSKVPMTSVTEDTSGAWDATASTDYVVPVAGVYLLQGYIRPPSTPGSVFAVGIGKNANDGDQVTWREATVDETVPFTLSVSSTQRLAVGDRVSLFTKHLTDSSVVLTRAAMTIVRVSA